MKVIVLAIILFLSGLTLSGQTNCDTLAAKAAKMRDDAVIVIQCGRVYLDEGRLQDGYEKFIEGDNRMIAALYMVRNYLNCAKDIEPKRLYKFKLEQEALLRYWQNELIKDITNFNKLTPK